MTPAVRTVMMTADTVGGVFTYAVELARALSRHGVDVALATMGAPCSRQQRAEVAALPNVALFESEFKLEWMDDCWDDVRRAGDFLLRLERRVRPDCVHLNGYAHGVLPFRAPVVMVGHSCVLSWWQAVKGTPLPPRWDDYAQAVRAGLAAADVVIAPSRDMLACLERHYGTLGDARVIPNGADAGTAACAEKQPLVLSAGRLWDEAKNVGALLDVAGRVPWPVVLAGPEQGPSGNALRPTSVRLLGTLPRQELRGWLARAAIYALPARYEPFGLSVLEAAQAGCALVLGDIPSLREHWSDAALFVPPDDREALERALHELIAAPALRSRLSREARTRAGEFTPELMARRYLRAYRDAVVRANRDPKEKTACA